MLVSMRTTSSAFHRDPRLSPYLRSCIEHWSKPRVAQNAKYGRKKVGKSDFCLRTRVIMNQATCYDFCMHAKSSAFHRAPNLTPSVRSCLEKC